MSQDYSRITFDPGQDYLGVLLQQGRPLMDADWNSLVVQLNRRTQAGALDTLGPAVVPKETEDGFLITPVPGGFTIGRGRIYVDGLLAENHGAGARTWDPHLAEEYRPDPLAWDDQPYMPIPVDPPTAPYLVYIDVWQREISELQDEELVDVAVGVDTTARLQTVWQVRTLGELAADSDCGTPLEEIPGWTAATAPSAGRLTTDTGDVPDEPDPCLVPPLGGYKGGENQLYRVEVHTGGEPGTATFKWSRDNGSIVSRVQRIPDLTHLVLDWTQKDEVLRFDDGDWVEILDDALELNGGPGGWPSGGPGILRQIAANGVNDGTRTLTLAAALPAGQFPVDVNGVPTGNLHTRVRKWNQSGVVRRADGTDYVDLDVAGSTGEIIIPADATQLLLENGILVSFSVATAGGVFHSGDWWTFCARANDASIEILDAAPPRAIHHHYAKLAVVLSDDESDDCREIWPPDSCCTVVVHPGESIQDAIDSLPDAGGCVCLKSGVHEIDTPIVIGRSNIVLHGEAPGARVVGGGLEFLLMVGGEGLIENIEIAMISFEYDRVSPDFPSPWLILLFDSRRVQVHDCSLRFTSPGLLQITGIYAFDCLEVRVEHSLFERCYWGLSADGGTSQLAFEGNTLRGALYETPDGPIPFSAFGAYFVEGSDGEVRGNHFEDFATAVQAWGGNAAITDNDITRRALPASLDNPTQPGELLYAIALLGTARSRVHGNRIDLASQGYGGVLITGRCDEVTNNRFTSTFITPSLVGPIGVFAGDFSGPPSGAGDFATVALNHFVGMQVAVTMRNPQGVRIADNSITGVELSGIGIMLTECSGSVVADNSLRDLGLAVALSNGNNNRLIDNTAADLRVAALVGGERTLELDGNVFENASLMGVVLLNTAGNARVLNTRIAHCGYRAESLAFSLLLLQSADFALHEVTIEGCEFFDTGVAADGTQTGGIAYGVASAFVSHLQFANNRTAYSVGTQLAADREHRALLLIGVPCFTVRLASAIIEIALGAALITGNVFEGPAQTTLVDIRSIVVADNIDLRFEKLTFASNRCDHVARGGDAVITADIFGSHMIVTGNQVKTPPGGFSIGLGGRDNVALMSNYTTRPYTAVGSTVPAAFANFNVIIP